MSQLPQAERCKHMTGIFSVALATAILASACRWSDTLLAETNPSVCANYQSLDGGAGQALGPVAWYSCESAAGTSETVLPDSTEHGNDATLHTDVDGGLGYGFAAGKIGNALDLVSVNRGYVMLPPGLLAGACEATIASWVYINSNANSWSRIWDFGRDTNAYLFLTPSTNYDGRAAKFAITVNGRTNEQSIEAPSAIPTLQWTHIAVVLGPMGGTLYFNGAPVGTNPTMTLRPADLGGMVNNYIGRSQYPEDPYLDGDIDEFRVYDRALSPDEVQALASSAQ